MLVKSNPIDIKQRGQGQLYDYNVFVKPCGHGTGYSLPNNFQTSYVSYWRWEEYL